MGRGTTTLLVTLAVLLAASLYMTRGNRAVLDELREQIASECPEQAHDASWLGKDGEQHHISVPRRPGQSLVDWFEEFDEVFKAGIARYGVKQE